MQVLFLHLSDIHLQVNCDYSSEKIRRIVDAVPCELPFDCAFLIISGDPCGFRKCRRVSRRKTPDR